MFLIDIIKWYADLITPWGFSDWVNYLYLWLGVGWVAGALLRRFAPDSCPELINERVTVDKPGGGYNTRTVQVHKNNKDCLRDHGVRKYHVAYREGAVSLGMALTWPLIFVIIPVAAIATIVFGGFYMLSEMGRPSVPETKNQEA